MTTGPSSEQTADLMQKLSLESQPKSLEISEPTKKLSGNQYGTVDSKDNVNGQTQTYDRSMTPMSQDYVDPSMCYPLGGYPPSAYYFGDEWGDFGRAITPDGLEMPSGVYDNTSVMYQNAYGYGTYAPYSPSSQVPSMGHDGQLYGPQQYQYSQYFHPSYPASPAEHPQGDVATSAAPDQKSLSGEPTNGNSNVIVSGGGLKGNNVKSTYQKPSYNNSNGAYGKGGSYAGGYSGYQDTRYNYDALRSPMSWSDGSANSIMPSISNSNNLPYSRNQNLGPYTSPYMGLQQPRPTSGMGTQAYTNRMYPNKLYNQYGSTVRSGFGYGSNGYDYRVHGRGWYTVDSRFRTRGRGFGYANENMDGLNELNRGPRAKGAKNDKDLVPTTEAIKEKNETNDEEKDKLCVIPDRELYNVSDFPVDYANAKFFIIKSYSEDDVHKSIKYNVWASTPNGNKKLDAAYQEKSGADPIFLFFSVNTSGQFVGVAEMIGPVDFNKNLEYWQQDKWMGCLSLKWHIVKDLPNSLLKHIILENNENKPVTNSRDTQEVKLEQGLQMIKIFKEHSCKTCILDDFGFYEARQKTIQEKKAKQQLIQKQVWEGKLSDEKNKEGELKLQKSQAVSSDLSKDTASPGLTNGDVKVSENRDDLKGTKPVEVLESKIAANGC